MNSYLRGLFGPYKRDLMSLVSKEKYVEGAKFLKKLCPNDLDLWNIDELVEFLEQLKSYIIEENSLRQVIKKIIKEETAKVIPIKKPSIESYLQMSPEQFASLSPEETSEILNDVLPSLEKLESQTKQLEWIFDQLKEQKLLDEAKKFKDNTLRYKNVLITLVQQSYSDPRAILKRLEQENPKLIKLIEKIKEEETRTIDKIRKGYSETKIRPKGYPNKPEIVVVESKSLKNFMINSWQKVKSVWNSLSDRIYNAWINLFDDLNDEIELMREDIKEES